MKSQISVQQMSADIAVSILPLPDPEEPAGFYRAYRRQRI